VWEIRVFTDPFYREDIATRISKQLEINIAPKNKIIWLGKAMAITPEESRFVEYPEYDDPFYYGFAFYSNAISYYLHQKSFTLFYPRAVIPFFKGELDKGDGLVLSPENPSTRPPFPPIYISKFDRYWVFTYKYNNSKTYVFEEPNTSSRIFLRQTAKGFSLEGAQLPRIFGWKILFKDGTSIDIKGLPLYPFPIDLEISKTIDPNTIQEIVTIPFIEMGLPIH
ncbi:MAG: hypothetical protein FD167_5361, partial [bacterium]